MSHQSRFDAQYWMLGAGALGRPRGMVRGGRREEGSGWGTRVYLWRIHVDIWQNQYNILKLKIKERKNGNLKNLKAHPYKISNNDGKRKQLPGEMPGRHCLTWTINVLVTV